MTTVKLSDGNEIPKIGLGTWNADRSLVKTAVEYAIDVGYRHFDCAMLYGNEDLIGDAIKGKIAEKKITRKDLFITAKVWNTYHSHNKVKESLQKTLKDLKMNYVDLYLVHWPFGFEEGGELFPKKAGKVIYSDVDYLETWKGMEDCRNEKLCRSIGLSNFNSQQIERVWENCEIKPVMLQDECHPYKNQDKLLRFCKEKKIAFTAYSCLASPSRPLKTVDDPILLEEPVIRHLACKYNKTPAQICLRYLIQSGYIVIPKSTTKNRIESNFQILNFELTDDHMYVIKNLNRNFRAVPLNEFRDHPYYPFNIEF